MLLYERAGFEFRTTPQTMEFRPTRQSVQRKIALSIVLSVALGMMAIFLLLIRAGLTAPLCIGLFSLVMVFAARNLSLHGCDPFLLDRTADRFQHGQKELSTLSCLA